MLLAKRTLMFFGFLKNTGVSVTYPAFVAAVFCLVYPNILPMLEIQVNLRDF